MSNRLVLRVSFVLAAIMSFSLFVAIGPAWAADCTSAAPDGLDAAIAKSTTGTAGTGNAITNKFTVTLKTRSTLVAAPCDITVSVQDILVNQDTTSYSGATCTPAAPHSSPTVNCTITFSNVGTGQTISRQFSIFTDATADANVCDEAGVLVTTPPLAELPSDLGNNTTGQKCAKEPSTPAPDGGGGGFGDFDDNFGGGFGDFGNFGSDFSTVATPIGGVDTGAGGTAGNSAPVPQVALGSLLAIGFVLLGLRRSRRA